MNNKFSSFKIIAIGITIACSVIGNLNLVAAMPPSSSGKSASSSSMPPMPMPSEADLQQFEAQLKKEIDDAVTKMSPDQQKIFFDTMEKLDKMAQTEDGRQKLEKLVTGDMSEDELNSFLETIMPEEAKEQEEAPTKSSSSESTSKPVAKPAPAPKPTGKQEQLRVMIQNIIEKTNSFLLKTGTYGKLASKVSQWQTKGIVHLPAKTTWTSLRSSLYEFVQKLNKAIEFDKKSGTYKHLEELAKQESLTQQLGKIEKLLVQHEPQIEESGTIEAEMNNKSQKAIQSIISGLGATILEARINEELELIFTKFEPSAKKSQEETKALQEKALQEQKKGRQPGVTTTSGSRSADAQGGAFIPSYPSSLNRPSSAGSISSKESGSTKPELAEPSQKEGGAGSKGGADKGKGGKKEDGKESKEKDGEKKGKEKKEENKKKEETLTKDQKAIQELMIKDPVLPFYKDQIIDNINDLGKAVKNPLLADIKNRLTDEKPVDITVVNKTIPEAMRLAGDIHRDIERVKDRLKTKKIGGQIAQGIKGEIKKAYATLVKTAQPFMQQVEDIKKNWDSIKDSVSKEKQYAYLRIDTAAAKPDMGGLQEQAAALDARVKRGEVSAADAEKQAAELLGKQMGAAQDPLAAIKAKVTPQASLYELQETLIKLGETINSL